MNTIHYLETSAVNVLADSIDDFEFVAYLQKAMKVDFCVSAVVIWEVLLNSSESRKEKLLYWLQFNCAEYLLKSPTELVVSYIRAGMPENDKKSFWYNRESSLELAKTWKRIHRNADKTLPVDLPALKECTDPIREFSKMNRSLLDAMTDKSQDGYEDDPFHRMMIEVRTRLELAGELTRASERKFKASLILGLFIVCIGIELDNSPIRTFWEPIGLAPEQPFEKLEYLVSRHPTLFVRGPLAEMALMIEAQTQGADSSNRGTFIDCLHTIYCYYADNVISNDKHFLALKEKKLAWFFDGILSAESYVSLIHGTRDRLLESAKLNGHN